MDEYSTRPVGRPLDIRQVWTLIRRWRQLPVIADHGAVMSHLAEEGGISARFCVMTVLSCGIAILGLLQSSAAVVIGAMLISPLMGPIILFGFSLAELNGQLAARSLKAIALGTVLAVSQAAIIVWLSPLNAVTAEILARTRPNFFDLLVAIFSAVAGAYAVVHRKGETIVGVAIATALMPPLAVVGYGLAVQNWAIFGGALGLFMTNMLAISLTASLVAKFYGFGLHRRDGAVNWHIAGILGVFAVLSIPLALSLRELAGQALTTTKVRNTLGRFFVPPRDHIYGVNVSFPAGEPVAVEALVLTDRVRSGMEAQVRHKLEAELREPVSLVLSQSPVHPAESLDRQAVQEMVNQSSQGLARQIQNSTPGMTATVAAAAGVGLLDVSVDENSKTLVVRGRPADSLMRLRAAGTRLAALYPQWKITVRPDLRALPPLFFDPHSAALGAPQSAALQAATWALQNNDVEAVTVRGYSDSADTARGNRAMATARAEAVAQRLRAAGLTVTVETDYPVPDQRTREVEKGRAFFRRAEIIVP